MPKIAERQDRIAAAGEERWLILREAARSRNNDDAGARTTLMIEECRDESSLANLAAADTAPHEAAADLDRCGFSSLLGGNRCHHRSRLRFDERAALDDVSIKAHRPKQTHRILARIGARLRDIPAEVDDAGCIGDEHGLRAPSMVQVVDGLGAHGNRRSGWAIAHANGDGLVIQGVSSVGFDAHAMWVPYEAKKRTCFQ
jgi:hypothetical protein